MLRSVTVANIINYDGGREKSNFRQAPVYLLISVGAIEFFLSSIYFSQATFFLVHAEDEDFSLARGYFRIVVVLVATQGVVGALTRSLCEYYENCCNHRYFLISLALILLMSVLSCSKIESHCYRILVYGVLGGTVSSCISSFLQYFLEEQYDLEQTKYLGIVQVAKSIGLLLIPFSMTYVVKIYTLNSSLQLLSAFVAHIIPCLLLVKKNKLLSHFPSTRASENFQEMTELTPMASTIQPKPQDESTSSSEKPDDDVDEEDDYLDGVFWQEDDDSQKQVDLNYMNSVQNYYSRMFGVNILPSIDEETQSQLDINEITSKRLSQITARLEELNKTDNKPARNSQVYFSEPQPPTPPPSNDVYFPEIKRSCCSPYKTYLWKRRWRKFWDFFTYNFAVPTFRSLINVSFYPLLLSKSANLLVATSFTILAPYIANQKIHNHHEEATFLLTYSGFTWCFFLLALPVLITVSNFKIRIVHICGHAVLMVCFKLLSRPLTNDILIISCMLFGLGYGITNYTENIVYRDFLGARHWRDSKGCLSTLSALMFLTYYTIIEHLQLNYDHLLKYAVYIYLGNTVLWTVAPVAKTIAKWGRKYCMRKQDDVFIN